MICRQPDMLAETATEGDLAAADNRLQARFAQLTSLITPLVEKRG